MTGNVAGQDATKGDRTRLHILNISADLFARRGFARTTFADLIAAAGMAKGAFYFHFRSKDELALEVIRYKQASWLKRVTDALEGEGSGIDRFRALGNAVLDLYETDATHWAISRLSLELGAEPELRPQIQAVMAEWNRLIADVVRACQAEGSFRTGLAPEAVAEIAMATFNGLKDLTDIRGAETDFRPRMQGFVELLLAGLSTHHPPAQAET